MDNDKACVLYVDDEPMNLKLFEATFRKNYQVLLADSAEKALDMLSQHNIQILVSDQRMPGMRGTELLEMVTQEYPRIRRFLLTAYTDSETLIEGVNKGKIHGYFKKPLKAEEVRTSFDAALETYYLRQKNNQILEELEKANAELRNLDHLKSEIINSISNEISTPLSRIMGTLHLLKSKIKGDELSEVVNILDLSVQKLEQFSLLARQISELKSPGFQLSEEDVSLQQVIQYAYIQTREELKNQNVKLDISHSREPIILPGDSALLTNGLVGVLHFALEHTDPEGSIQIRLSGEDGMRRCSVVDQGLHYAEGLIEMLEKQYNGEEKALNLSMGIELALSQMIMEIHHGHILFEKTKDGHGCLEMIFPYE